MVSSTAWLHARSALLGVGCSGMVGAGLSWEGRPALLEPGSRAALQCWSGRPDPRLQGARETVYPLGGFPLQEQKAQLP